MPGDDDVSEALAWIMHDYRELVATAAPEELAAPSRVASWSNRQLLFHMWFGQRIARAFMHVIGVFGRLPRPVSTAYARLLTALTGPYNWVNHMGPVGGARVVPLARVERWMTGDTEALLRWTTGDPRRLELGMAAPATWDPYFQPWMTRRDVLRWAPMHYRHHRAQLTLTGVEGGQG